MVEIPGQNSVKDGTADDGDVPGDDELEDVDQLLKEAKRVKNDTLLNKIDQISSTFIHLSKIRFLFDMFIPLFGYILFM